MYNNQYDVDQEIQTVIWNAKIPNGENRVSRDLTEKQAHQIIRRSYQLAGNGDHAPANHGEKARQIEECWRLWLDGRA